MHNIDIFFLIDRNLQRNKPIKMDEFRWIPNCAGITESECPHRFEHGEYSDNLYHLLFLHPPDDKSLESGKMMDRDSRMKRVDV
jgi:hypothetical protein